MNNRLILIMLIFLFPGVKGYGQDRKNHFPAATFHQGNAQITGLSFGIASGFKETHTNVVTNGTRLELIGLGLLLPLIPHSPINENDNLVSVRQFEFTEKINGLNISGSGTVCGDCIVNGLTVGAIGQYLYASNGISISIVGTIIEDRTAFNSPCLMTCIKETDCR